MDEFFVEVGIENSVDSMVEESVSDGCFVNVPRLRVGDIECVVAFMSVCFVIKIVVECKDIVH